MLKICKIVSKKICLKKISYLIISLIFVFNLSSCRSKNEYVRYQKDYPLLFDTYVSFFCYANSEEEFKKYCGITEDTLEKFNRLFDIYNNYDGINNIKTINDNAGKAPVKVDDNIISLLEYGKEFYIETDGAVNIAFGSVLSVWHNYRDEGKSVPEISELQNASKHTDINSIEIDKKNSTVFINDKSVSIDVGCCAKGYAVQKASEELKKAGAEDFLINAGGNVCAAGKPIEKDAWKVGIELPDGSASEIAKVLEISDKAVVTSGDYQRFYEVDGKRYHHIIDPKTLFPSEICRSATVIAEDSAAADMLSTAIFILPIEKSRIILEKYNAEAVWIMEDGEIITA